MKLLVGLGNPGNEYTQSRHNLGFMAIDKIASFYGVKDWKQKMNGLYQTISINHETIMLLKPQKYMNLSGEVVSSFVQFYHIDIDSILIIVDDMDLPSGRIRLKMKGSSGGHNGLKNIELHLHSQDYKRLKIGISHSKDQNTKNYVLGKLTLQEQSMLSPIIELMPTIVQDYVNLTFVELMNKYNGVVIEGNV